MKVAIASDHGGYELKQFLIEQLQGKYEFIDCGCSDGTTSVDYPNFALEACNKVLNKEAVLCILVCGTGIGMSIAANKISGIRCGLCHTEYEAQMTRAHNNANVLALGGRVLGCNQALAVAEAFLAGSFLGDRHQKRLDLITAIEKSNAKV